MPPLTIRMTALRNRPPNIRVEAIVASVVVLQRARAQRIINRLKEYPPELPGQQYVRTGVLGESWEILPTRITHNGIVTEYENAAVDERGRPYARWVYGTRNTQQYFLHRGRWPRAYDAEIQDVAGYRRDLIGIIRRNIV